MEFFVIFSLAVIILVPRFMYFLYHVLCVTFSYIILFCSFLFYLLSEFLYGILLGALLVVVIFFFFLFFCVFILFAILQEVYFVVYKFLKSVSGLFFISSDQKKKIDDLILLYLLLGLSHKKP